MLGIIATIKVQDGKADEFVAGFKRLQAAVMADEPGCKFYALHVSSDDPNTFVVMEQYEDKAALEAHGKSAHMAEAGPMFAGCLAGRPEVQILKAV